MTKSFRFADDVILFAKVMEDLKTILAELENASGEIGLRVNLSKTQIICPDDPKISIRGTKVVHILENKKLLHIFDPKFWTSLFDRLYL